MLRVQQAANEILVDRDLGLGWGRDGHSGVDTDPPDATPLVRIGDRRRASAPEATNAAAPKGAEPVTAQNGVGLSKVTRLPVTGWSNRMASACSIRRSASWP